MKKQAVQGSDDDSNSVIRGGYKQHSGTLSVGLVFTVIAISVVITVLGLASYFYQSMTDANKEYHQNQGRQMALTYAGVLESFSKRYTHSLELIATDPEIAQAVENNDALAIKRLENKVSLQFPYAYRIKLLRKGLGSPDHNLRPAITEACLYLKQLAASGKPPTMDIHGSPDLHIDVVRRIPGEQGKTVGFVMLTLKLKSVLNVIKQYRTQGYVELRQKALDKFRLITSAGNNRYRVKDKEFKVRVYGTPWLVYFWPKPLLSSLSADAQVFYIAVIGGVILIVLLLVYVLYRMLVTRLVKDQATFIYIMKDIKDRDLADRYPAYLRNFRSIVPELMRMAQDVIKGHQRPRDERLSEPMAPPVKTKKLIDKVPTDIVLDQDDLMGALDLSLNEVEEEVVTGKLPLEIFRAYDIRGIVDTQLTPEVVYDIGRAIGSEAYARGEEKVVVGRDGRLSGPALSKALCDGLRATGREVIDIGQVPTPTLYFATQILSQGSGVMITGSHNPPEYNGLKIMLRGDTLFGETITALGTRILEEDFVTGEGDFQEIDISSNYISRLVTDINLKGDRKPKVIVDCGNGVAGDTAPETLRQLGCEVVEMYCEVDGNFPNHHPDPSKLENIAELRKAVVEQKADLGVAFDGDGDRLGVIDSKGNVIWPDRVMMILAEDVLRRNPGAEIIYDVKCTRNLAAVIKEHGGKPLMWKTGHSFIKAKMRETGALLAGEMSGHLFIKERWYGFDDALYACARLLEALSGDERSSAEIFAALPDTVNTPELNIMMKEGETFPLIDKLIEQADFGDATIITLDGIRVEYADGWGLIRSSNTTPCLVLRFEADTEQALERIQAEFKKNLANVAPDLKWSF